MSWKMVLGLSLMFFFIYSIEGKTIGESLVSTAISIAIAVLLYLTLFAKM